MAKKKTTITVASKTKKRATINKNSNTTKNTAVITTVGTAVLAKSMSKASKATKTTAILMLILGLLIGAVSCYFMTKNDCFELIGKDEITLTLEYTDNETGLIGTYTEQGVKIISFNQDVSDDIIIEVDPKLIDNNDGTYSATQIGTYYIKYHSNNIKYGSIFTVERIRLITFVEPSEGTVKEEIN